MRYLLNNIEQRQPYNSNETFIELYARPAEAPERCERITVRGFRPYFYARANETLPRERELLSNDSVQEIEYVDYNLFKDDAGAAKIFTPKPQDVPDAKQLFEDTWAADVPFVNRFLIDTGVRAYFSVPDDWSGETIHFKYLEPIVPPQ